MSPEIVIALSKLVEVLGLKGILVVTLGPGLGVPTVVLVLWFLDKRNAARTFEKYREDMRAVLGQYGEHQRELEDMYQNNVELVKGWQRVAESLQTLVVTNTEALSNLCTQIATNQYCPYVRLTKHALGPVENRG